jgi:hypothetical protein
MALIKLNNRSSEDNAIHGKRNLLINGAMTLAQRGTSFADPSDDTYSLDRMHVFNDNDGAFTVTQDTTVPSGEGFYKSIKFDCTTIDGTIAAGQYATLSQRIEGFNNAVLGYGTSGAKSIVVSFYAKSNLTGTFCYSVRNSATNRAYIKEFSLTSANTWERISFTIPGDTSGTWLVDSGIGSNHQISLSMGSTYHGTANQWNSSNVVATSNQVNFLSSTDNNFFLTGWQMEIGDVATPFEHEDIATTLVKCQRYYQKIWFRANNIFTDFTGTQYATQSLVNQLRSNGAVTNNITTGANISIDSMVIVNANTLQITCTSGGSHNNWVTGNIFADAEL